MKKQCPCASGKRYMTCCHPYIAQVAVPLTPEALMRSRYTAYSKAKINYIVATMKGEALSNFDAVAAEVWAQAVEWQTLKVINAPVVAAGETTGIVEFIAYFKEQGVKRQLHEKSQFIFDEGHWYYTGQCTE